MDTTSSDMAPPINMFPRRVAFFTAVFVLWVVGFILGIYHLFFLCAAVLSAVLISYASVRIGHRALKASVHGPSDVSEGASFSLGATLRNAGKVSRLFVEVGLPSQTWLEPVNGRPLQRSILAIAPGQSLRITFNLHAKKRGVYRYDHLRLLTRDPFGLFISEQQIRCNYELVVYPRIIPLHVLLHTPGQAFHELGESSGERGRLGMEFYGVREYQPGDPWRRIHWKATAHTGKLSVVEMEEEQQGWAVIILDCDENIHWGEGKEASIERAVTIAASLANELLQQHALVTLIAEPFIPLPGLSVEERVGIRQILHQLAFIEPTQAPPLAQVLDGVRQQWGRYVSVIVVSTDHTTERDYIHEHCDMCFWITQRFIQVDARAAAQQFIQLEWE